MGSRNGDNSSPLTPYEEISQTQNDCEPNDMTMLMSSPTRQGTDKPKSNIWGSLRRRGGDQEEIQLEHRSKDGKRDTYIIGRSRGADIAVDDKRVSSSHCMIYCDYEEARLRVFVEDTSVNGTYVNDSLTRLHKGKRLELKTGDEIFLINPRNLQLESNGPDKCTSFLYVNLRDRLFVHRTIAPSRAQSNEVNTKGDVSKHVEDFYVIGDQLGSGMCGQVHMCMNRVTGEHYAVKIIDTRKFALTPGLSPSELREEAEMMRMLDHPNIIRIKDTFETDNVIFIVMELVRGGDLFDRIVEKGRYSEDAAREVMSKLLSAVSYLHANNIIHRDLKPENILLVSTVSDTDVMLTDFGLAKRANQEGLKTFCGTPQYFAPEVLKRKSTIAGAGRYGTSADMWSLGVVLYILLSGAFPFNDDENLFHQIQNAQYSVTGSEWVSISDSAKHLVRSLLTLRPEQRITVQQAMQHPWVRGESALTASFTGTGTGTGVGVNHSESVLSGPSGSLGSAAEGTAKKTQRKARGSGSGKGPPQLELSIQPPSSSSTSSSSSSSFSRPPFGSCSWSHRGSQLSQNSQNSQNSTHSQMSLYGASSVRALSSSTPEGEGITYKSEDSAIKRLDGLSLFRMATGVTGDSGFVPSVPLSLPIRLSTALRSSAVRRDSAVKQPAKRPSDSCTGIGVESVKRAKTIGPLDKGSENSSSSSSSSCPRSQKRCADAVGLKDGAIECMQGNSKELLRGISNKNTGKGEEIAVRKPRKGRGQGIAAEDAVELSDDGIEEFCSDGESSQNVRDEGVVKVGVRGKEKVTGRGKGKVKGTVKEDDKAKGRGKSKGTGKGVVDRQESARDVEMLLARGGDEVMTVQGDRHKDTTSSSPALLSTTAASSSSSSSSSSALSVGTYIASLVLVDQHVGNDCVLDKDCEAGHRVESAVRSPVLRSASQRIASQPVSNQSPRSNVKALFGRSVLSPVSATAVKDAPQMTETPSPATASTQLDKVKRVPPEGPHGPGRGSPSKGLSLKRTRSSSGAEDSEPGTGMLDGRRRKVQAVSSSSDSHSHSHSTSTSTSISASKAVPSGGRGSSRKSSAPAPSVHVSGTYRGSLEEAWSRSKPSNTPANGGGVAQHVSSSGSGAAAISGSGSGSDSGNSSGGGGGGGGGGCLTRSLSVLHSVDVRTHADADTASKGADVPSSDRSKKCNANQSESVTVDAMLAKPSTAPPVLSATSGVAGIGVGVGGVRRKLRVSMKTLVDIFQQPVNAAHRNN